MTHLPKLSLSPNMHTCSTTSLVHGRNGGVHWQGCGKVPTGCSTGLVTPPPPPPLPPAPTKGPLGGEASPQYVNYARGMRWPTYVNGSTNLNRTTEMTADGWPLVDCTIVIFDKRPTGAWAPPIDDPEQRYVHPPHCIKYPAPFILHLLLHE